MFHLHISNKTENLVAQLIQLFVAEPRRDPMVRESFLIQSHGMERMLSQRLAEALPVWCNMEYLWPARFFERLAQGLGVEGRADLFSRECMSWRIETMLRDHTDQTLAPLQHYITGDNGPLKRFQLARQLADLFDQYQIMRPDMLAGWTQGQRSTGNVAEGWQMAIWQRLLASEPGLAHRGERLERLIQRLEQSPNTPIFAPKLLPSRLMVFGLHSIPPLLLAALHGVARHCEVHFFLLALSRCSWQEGQEKNEEPQACSHPLLLSCGNQAREFQEMLLTSPDLVRHPPVFVDPLQAMGDGTGGLLQLIQSDLLAGAVSVDPPCQADDSLIVAACHSPLRELMALKDQILHWLDTHPDMEPSDVLVMAPDIQVYAPLIPAVFADLPHSIADRSLLQSEHPGRILLSFLTLLDGRFGWSDVLALLENPAVYPAFGLSQDDLELVRHWVLGAGIRWGLSAEQCRDTELPAVAETSWQDGLDRLFLGCVMRSDSLVEGILPYGEIEGGSARPLGGLALFVEFLDEARTRCARDQSLAQWSLLLLDYSTRLLATGEGKGVGETSAALARVLALLTPVDEQSGASVTGAHDGLVSLAVIRFWLECQLEGEGGSSGFLRGRLTFCSMLPMRSIPFRALCVLGLNDGTFPRADQGLPFDLLAEESRPGDRSRRSDDRHQFLEALGGAREFLYLSYVGRSQRNNDEIPPSLLISELLELLRSQYRLEPIFRHHHLHPFARDYFHSDSPFFSYDREACTVAQILARSAGRKEVGPQADWWQGQLPALGPEVDFADLCSFFANPQKFFVRSCLGIRLDSTRSLPGTSEPFDLNALERYSVQNELVVAVCAGLDTEQVLARLMVSGRWPQGGPGKLGFTRQLQELEPFVQQIRAAGLGQQLPPRIFGLNIGPYHLSGHLEHLHEQGQLLSRYATWRGRDLFRGLLHHLVAACLDVGGDRTFCLTRDRAALFTSTAGAKVQLERLIDLYILGCRQPSPLWVDPAWDYFQARFKAAEGEVDLGKIKGGLVRTMEKGWEDEWALLYPDFKVDEILGAEFVACCEELFPMVREVLDEQ